jgi:hypothetical protein
MTVPALSSLKVEELTSDNAAVPAPCSGLSKPSWKTTNQRKNNSDENQSSNQIEETPGQSGQSSGHQAKERRQGRKHLGR